MSISGSQETKVAILEAHPSADTSEQAQLDAQEDREILGIRVSMNFSNFSSLADSDRPNGDAQIHVGTNQISSPGAGSTDTQDNVSFHTMYRAHTGADDGTGGLGLQDMESGESWYGHGSGIEWNEDATLTVDVTANVGDIACNVFVYYREL